MRKQEYDDYKDNLVKERDMIRKGKERVKEKIKASDKISARLL